MNDGRKEQESLWYRVYFYYPLEHQIVFTWTRPSGENKTTFAFVSISQGLGNWKEINKDFGNSEKRQTKEDF